MLLLKVEIHRVKKPHGKPILVKSVSPDFIAVLFPLRFFSENFFNVLNRTFIITQILRDACETKNLCRNKKQWRSLSRFFLTCLKQFCHFLKNKVLSPTYIFPSLFYGKYKEINQNNVALVNDRVNDNYFKPLKYFQNPDLLELITDQSINEAVHMNHH